MSDEPNIDQLTEEVRALLEQFRDRTSADLPQGLQSELSRLHADTPQLSGSPLGLQLARAVVARRHGIHRWSQLRSVAGADNGSVHDIEQLAHRSFDHALADARRFVSVFDLMLVGLDELQRDPEQTGLVTHLEVLNITAGTVKHHAASSYADRTDIDGSAVVAPTPRWYSSVAAAKAIYLLTGMSAATALLGGLGLEGGLDPLLEVAGVDPSEFLEIIGIELAASRTAPALGGLYP